MSESGEIPHLDLSTLDLSMAWPGLGSQIIGTSAVQWAWEEEASQLDRVNVFTGSEAPLSDIYNHGLHHWNCFYSKLD